VRPVNLIPLDERRGEAAPLRTGPTAYVLIGALALVLLTVTALVMTGNSIKASQAELDSLQAREQAATAAAASLSPYTQFASLAESRNATVASLAQSRFDWERVLRELSLIVPEDVTLMSASASSSPGGSEGGSSLAEGSTGPSLSFQGCAEGHKGVAAFAAALHDIDGVTRVGVNSSQLGGDTGAESGGGGGAGSAEGGGGCATSANVSSFEIAVAFDNVAVPTDGSAAVPPPADGAATDPATADGLAEQQQSRDAATDQTEKARRAANLAPGVDQ
jgi:Tfp pilus assembly protein PilN